MFTRVIATFLMAATMAVPATAQTPGEETMSSIPTNTDRVAINGVELYYEVHG